MWATLSVWMGAIKANHVRVRNPSIFSFSLLRNEAKGELLGSICWKMRAYRREWSKREEQKEKDRGFTQRYEKNEGALRIEVVILDMERVSLYIYLASTFKQSLDLIKFVVKWSFPHVLKFPLVTTLHSHGQKKRGQGFSQPSLLLLLLSVRLEQSIISPLIPW